MPHNGSNRLDHKIIFEMIEPGSRVLDLGCGDGTLLCRLMTEKSCRTFGIERAEKEIFKCIERGVSVTQGDFNTGLDDYLEKAFDYVIVNESLQEVLDPARVILEAVRVGKKVIVGIPNFGYITGRFQIFFNGQVPVTKWLPYKWYNTPNIRFLTLKDFRNFCTEKGITVLRERGLGLCSEVTILPNLFAHVGLFLLTK